MMGRAYDPRDAGLPPLRDRPRTRHRPGIVLTRKMAAVVVVAGYTAMALGAWAMFSRIAAVHRSNDMRDEQASVVFGVLMAAFGLWSLFAIYRRPRRPRS